MPRRLPRYLSTDHAARIVGVGSALFKSLAEEFADDWLRPVYLGRGGKKVKKWLLQDVLCLAHIYSRRQTMPPEAPLKKGGKPGAE